MKFIAEKPAEPATVSRAFVAQSQITQEPATGETPVWVSVSSDAPIVSLIKCSHLRAAGYSPRNVVVDDGVEKAPAIVVVPHTQATINSQYIRDGIVLRDKHGGDTVGILTPAYVRGGKLGGDKIIWGTSERAQVIMRDVEKGVRRNISVEGDWSPSDLVLEGEKDGIPVIRASVWTPLAAAFVDVPADPNVGVARAHAADEAKPEPINQPAAVAPLVRSHKIMHEQEINDREIARAKESVEIFALARDYNVPQEQVNQHITSGGSLSDFRGIVLRDFAANKAKADAAHVAVPVKDAPVTRSVLETIPAEKLAGFSLMRALKGVAKSMSPDVDLGKFDDGLEREVSQEAVRLIRSTPGGETYVPRGLCVPWDLVRAHSTGAIRRDFTVAGGGSNVVAQNLRPELFIDQLRSRLVLSELGITMLTGLVGDVLIPKQTATATGGWIDESSAAPSGQLTLGQIKLTPRTLGAYTDVSRQLLMQSTPSADMLTMDDLVNSLARSLQTGALHGTGANNQPTGLFTALANGYQGYAAITEATVSSDGAPTYAEVESLIGGVEEANVDGLIRGLMRPKAFRYFKTLGRVGTTGAVPAGSESNGKKYVADLEVSTTTSLTTKYATFGRWDSMVLAMWGALDLTLDPYSLSTKGNLRVVALQSADVGFRYLPAFGWSSKFATSA